ncbi:MAG TPA: AraC family transcriptional regulator ligand-binding domain-containing protein [Gemmatimonadaceae bacterium]|nr:AraC family transcriptional regulator ligand-binding domain-containing protein [Gemmatimonadaceae bacterium]
MVKVDDTRRGVGGAMTVSDNRVTRRAGVAQSSSPPADAHGVREVRGLLFALEQLGFDLGALLHSAGLRREDVQDPDAHLSRSACAAVFATAQRQGLVKNLALRLAMNMPVGSSALLDYLIVSSDSVEQGLQRLTRYLRLVNPGVRMLVDDTSDPVRVIFERTAGPFEAEFTVCMSMLRFKSETDDQLTAAYVSFTHEPDDVAEYARVFQCLINTGASWDGWALPKSALRLPFRRRDPALRRVLDDHAAAMLRRVRDVDDVTHDVRRALSTLATAGDMRIDVVARRLATTPRTLQRRLAQKGTSFDALRDDTRKQAAEAHLTETVLTISEMTYLLGYSEPTAFHRAFKRWHGMTPQAYRELHRSTSDQMDD